MQDKSRISIQVGPHFEGNGTAHVNLTAQITKQSADDQLNNLKAQTLNNLDYEWALVASISAQPGKAAQLEEAIKTIKNLPDFSLDDFVLKTQIVEDKVWFSVKGNAETEAEIQEPFNMVFGAGLDNVAQNQQNQIKLNIATNQSFEVAHQSLTAGERLTSVLLKSKKILFELDLHQDLAEVVKGLIEGFDPDLASEPPMVLFRKFKNFKLDLDFKSADEFPEEVRKSCLPFKKFTQAVLNNEGGFPFDEMPQILELYENVGADIKVWFTIPDFVAVQVDVSLPQFAALFRDFAGAIQAIA